MRGDKAAGRPRWLNVRTAQGEPYQVGERTLIPVARVVSLGRARGVIGADQISGWGAGLVRVTPVAVIEPSAGGGRRVRIRSGTSEAIWHLAVAAFAAVLLLALVRRVVSSRRLGSVS